MVFFFAVEVVVKSVIARGSRSDGSKGASRFLSDILQIDEISLVWQLSGSISIGIN